MSGDDVDIEALRRRAEAAEAELTRFAESVSHDLRTPLSTVVGYLELLRVKASPALGESELVLLARAETGAVLLDRMLGGLTKVSRVKLAPVCQEVAWRSVIDRAISELPDDLVPYLDTITVADPLPTVQGDEDELVLAITAVLDNALRHRPDPADARVVVRTSESGALVIEDDGPGIPDSKLAEAVQLFHGDPPLGPGGGVGLALVSRIVDAHRGTLNLGPSTLGGLRVSVRI